MPECRSRLAQRHEGRLGYHSGRGPRAVVVSYALAEEHIVLRLPDYNEIVHYAPGERVTLEVDGAVPGVDGYDSVTVTGQAQLASSGIGDGRVNETGEPAPAGVLTSVIRLPITDIEGVAYTLETLTR